MSTIIPFLFILLSLTAIIVLMVRKFSQLSLLDVENLSEVKEKKKKEELLKKRLEKKAKVATEHWSEIFKPLVQKAKEKQLVFRKYVGKVERRLLEYTREKSQLRTKVKGSSGSEELRNLMQEGRQALETGDADTAERKFLSAIRLDPKQVEAYRGLGDVYCERGQEEEAKETYVFVLQLAPQDDFTMVKLAKFYEETGKIPAAVEYLQQAVLLNDNLSPRFVKLADLLEKLGQHQTALEAIKQAVELEPGNPKYLDRLIEISILAKDKILAQDAYQQLRMVNPDNHKLSSFGERIQKMPP